MQGRSHAWQDVGEPLNSPDAHSQDARLMWSFEAHIETLKEQLGKAEARAERQTAEFAERAAQVAAEHTAQLKTLEERIETLKAELSAADTLLAERATGHEANIAAERVKTEAEPLKTEAEQAKAARAMKCRRRSGKRCGSGPTGHGGGECGAPRGRRFRRGGPQTDTNGSCLR